MPGIVPVTGITDDQIHALRKAASKAGNLERYAICRRATDDTGCPGLDVNLDFIVQTTRGPVELWDLRQDEARVECERILATEDK